MNDGRDGHCDAARTADHQNRVWVDANVDVPLVQDVHDTAWGTSEYVIKDTAGHTVTHCISESAGSALGRASRS